MAGLSGCFGPVTTPAKVRIASGPPLAWGGDAAEYIDKSVSSTYLVHPGDTLWAIAAVHGIELENLAKWNNFENTSQLRVGQELRLIPPTSSGAEPPEERSPATISKPKLQEETIAPQKTLPLAKNTEPEKLEQKKLGPDNLEPKKAALIAAASPKLRKKTEKRTLQSKFKIWKLPKSAPSSWLWPHSGKIINRFGRRGQQRNNGIDIAVRVGDPVRAAADGIVAYADSGLPGYGKMILLRHGGSFMTAYGYVNQILVRRGQPVKSGERIALAGQSGHAQTPRLHFEIRHRVKPLNPLHRLPKRK
ncbi:MAG: peptidoglycan DD-metalloendopeptidase family protein [Magnetococcales bacterium]|nr:peptidoglycan DD-metalloendopeptidase family protein [Magnetococcales bacterium]